VIERGVPNRMAFLVYYIISIARVNDLKKKNSYLFIYISEEEDRRAHQNNKSSLKKINIKYIK
jgi:hypothetical protein